MTILPSISNDLENPNSISEIDKIDNAKLSLPIYWLPMLEIYVSIFLSLF